MELPGPIAAAIIARDEAVTSPSLTRLYPLVVKRGRGLRARRCRRQPLPRLQRRHRRRRGRPRPPHGQRRDPRPGRRRPPLLLERLLPPGLRRRRRAPRRARAVRRSRSGLPLQLGHRGGRGRPQAGPLPHRPLQRDRLPRRVPRPLARLAVAHRQQGPPARRLRDHRPRQLPRSVLRPGPSRGAQRRGLHRGGAVHEADDAVATWRRSSSSRSRARAATSSRPPAGSPRCATCATATASCSSSTRSSRASAAPARCGPVEHDGVEPDIICVGKGLASGLPARRHRRPDRGHGLGAGGHGSTFGGNPVACAAAVATLDLVDQGLAANAATVGAQLARRPRRPQGDASR